VILASPSLLERLQTASGPADEVVSISTYRDERRLFAIIGVVIVAALSHCCRLLRRQGRPARSRLRRHLDRDLRSNSPLQPTNGFFRGGVHRDRRQHCPNSRRENARCAPRTHGLQSENLALNEALARVPAERDLALAQQRYPQGLPATVIGYDPEATCSTSSRSIAVRAITSYATTAS
jgi:hypothetical protein